MLSRKDHRQAVLAATTIGIRPSRRQIRRAYRVYKLRYLNGGL
jgi:transposase